MMKHWCQTVADIMGGKKKGVEKERGSGSNQGIVMVTKEPLCE